MMMNGNGHIAEEQVAVAVGDPEHGVVAAAASDSPLAEPFENPSPVGQKRLKASLQTAKMTDPELGEVPVPGASTASYRPSETTKKFKVQDVILEESDKEDQNSKSESKRTSNWSLPRLVERNLPFSQSKNRIQVHHNMGYKIFTLVRHDWFHVFLRLPTSISLTTLISIWTLVILLYAKIYMWVDRRDPNLNCGLGDVGSPIEWGAAFAFSLETCTTVGYGLPSGTNAFFEECELLQFFIYCQMLCSMIFNAIFLAFLYNRISRSESRGVQVVFSEKAICSIVNNHVRLQMRLFDADAMTPIVEAHVRLYAVEKHRPVPRQLRLTQPNDELGGMLLLSLPTVITHQIDTYSLLHPPFDAKDDRIVPQQIPVHGLTLRQVDSVTCNREEVICPICGESYGTMERWIRHVRYQQVVERKDNYPAVGTHLSVAQEDLQIPDPLANLSPPEASMMTPAKANAAVMQRLRQHFANEISEVICIVEGIDPLMSGTFQAVHSYQIDDLVFHPRASFEPCLDIHNNTFRVDLHRFHKVDTAPEPEDDITTVAGDEKLDIFPVGSSVPAKPQQARKRVGRRMRVSSSRRHDALFE